MIVIGEISGVRETLQSLTDLQEKQLPFATALAINRTLEEGLAAGRAHVQQRLTVRVPSFTLPPLMLPNNARATKQRLQGQAAFGYPDVMADSIGERRNRLLGWSETGGVKETKDPLFPQIIPTEVLRPSFAQLVPRSMYPKNLGLMPRRDVGGAYIGGKRRGKVRGLSGEMVKSKKARRAMGLEGVGGTFTIVDETGRTIGVFQRTGPGRRDVRMLWWYEYGAVPVPDRLDFRELMRDLIDARFAINFDGAFALALRTAR